VTLVHDAVPTSLCRRRDVLTPPAPADADAHDSSCRDCGFEDEPHSSPRPACYHESCGRARTSRLSCAGSAFTQAIRWGQAHLNGGPAPTTAASLVVSADRRLLLRNCDGTARCGAWSARASAPSHDPRLPPLAVTVASRSWRPCYRSRSGAALASESVSNSAKPRWETHTGAPFRVKVDPTRCWVASRCRLWRRPSLRP
jgi:hypothetical protein